jgi:hypothetical protein
MDYFLWFYQSRYGPLGGAMRENKTAFTDGKEGPAGDRHGKLP